MNNYNFQNINYSTKRRSKVAHIIALLLALFEMIAENKRFVATLKITLATVAVVVFFGVFGGVEKGMISAGLGFSVCAAIALFGIIFCGENEL